jgi:hypothetical protein
MPRKKSGKRAALRFKKDAQDVRDFIAEAERVRPSMPTAAPEADSPHSTPTPTASATSSSGP